MWSGSLQTIHIPIHAVRAAYVLTGVFRARSRSLSTVLTLYANVSNTALELLWSNCELNPLTSLSSVNSPPLCTPHTLLFHWVCCCRFGNCHPCLVTLQCYLAPSPPLKNWGLHHCCGRYQAYCGRHSPMQQFEIGNLYKFSFSTFHSIIHATVVHSIHQHIY